MGMAEAVLENLGQRCRDKRRECWRDDGRRYGRFASGLRNGLNRLGGACLHCRNFSRLSLGHWRSSRRRWVRLKLPDPLRVSSRSCDFVTAISSSSAIRLRRKRNPTTAPAPIKNVMNSITPSMSYQCTRPPNRRTLILNMLADHGGVLICIKRAAMYI